MGKNFFHSVGPPHTNLIQMIVVQVVENAFREEKNGYVLSLSLSLSLFYEPDLPAVIILFLQVDMLTPTSDLLFSCPPMAY